MKAPEYRLPPEEHWPVEEIALVAGSFDPVTVGHEWLLREAAKRFRQVYITVFVNAEKEAMFPMEERLGFLAAVAEAYPNVCADTWEGYLADYCREKGITVVVKGYRDANDYAYEQLQAGVNHRLNPELQTLLLRSPAGLAGISSTAVREGLRAGTLPKGMLPPACEAAVEACFRQRNAGSC